MTRWRTLGVLGGMGPLAGAEFLRRVTLLTPAGRDQDHVPCVLWSDPRVPDRVAAALSGGESPVPALVRGLRGLEAAGCGLVAVPCNTAHVWYEEMRAATRLPVLHIVAAACDDLARAGVPPGAAVGVMGTAATLATGLFQERLAARGRPSVVPTAEEMARLVTPAIALVKANRVAEAYAPLREAAAALAARGAEAMVLGCTEIPLGVAAGPPLPLPVVDTLDSLARAALAAAAA